MSTGDRDSQRNSARATTEVLSSTPASSLTSPAPGKVTRTMPQSMAAPPAPFSRSRAIAAGSSDRADPWLMDDASMSAMGLSSEAGAAAVAASSAPSASSTDDKCRHPVGDVTSYLAKLGRLPAKVVAHLRGRFGKGEATDVAAEAAKDSAKVADEATEKGAERGTDAAGDQSDSAVTATRTLSADEWVEQLKVKLTPDELAQYEKMKGKWKSPEEMQQAFGGNLDAARADIAREVGKKAEAATIKERSLRRSDEIRTFVEEHGLMKHEQVRKVIEELPEKPGSQDLEDAVYSVRSFITSEMRAEEISARFPDAHVLREVKILRSFVE
jgi:hypothetical protein